MFLSIDYDAPVIFSDTVTLAVLGVIGVFVALIALMMIVKAVGAKKTKGAETLSNAAAEPVRPAPAAQPVPDVRSGGTPARIPAPGSRGDVDLYNVDDHTAALLMAIVADDLKADLNTLRFTSIREVAR